jgi:hypothetical protein
MEGGMRSGRARVNFLALWAALLALKLALAAWVPAFGDEAFYWQEGQHPAWAYSDLPALTAWLAALGAALGDALGLPATFALRLPFLALGALLPWQVVRVARRLGARDDGRLDEDAARRAWQAGTLAALWPVGGWIGLLALPDVPLLVAGMLCLEAGLRLLRRVDAGAAALLALGLALGALSHWRFALVVAAGVLGLALSARGRAALRAPPVLLAGVVGALAWWPLLQWNLAHGQAGLSFQLVERHPGGVHAGGLWWPLVQAAVVSPLLLVALATALRGTWRGWRGDPRAALLLGTAGLPLVAWVLGAFLADAERVSFHWPLAAWLALLPLAPGVIGRWSRGARVAVPALAALGLAAIGAWLFAAGHPALREGQAGGRWYPDNFLPVDALRVAVGEARAGLPADAPVVVDHFMLGAQLGLALGDPDLPVLPHPLNQKHGRAAQLALWGLLREEVPRPSLLVVEDSARKLSERPAAYAELCARAGGALPVPTVLSSDGGRKRLLLFALEAAPGPGPCAPPAIAWLDWPAAGAAVAPDFEVAGWALRAGTGVERIEVVVAGAVRGEARREVAREDVAARWGAGDPAGDRLGFRAAVTGVPAGRHRIDLRLHGPGGRVEDWPTAIEVEVAAR